MRFLIQRVSHAGVSVDGQVIGRIDKGFLVLIGVGQKDTKAEADRLVKKMTGLRIFEDQEGKTNLPLADVGGELLLVSQFTLYANCKKGNRPSFTDAAEPRLAQELYEYIIAECRKKVATVETGSFGAEMQVELCNDGPFTVILDTDQM